MLTHCGVSSCPMVLGQSSVPLRAMPSRRSSYLSGPSGKSLGLWEYVLEEGRFTLTSFCCVMSAPHKPQTNTADQLQQRSLRHRGVCHNSGKSTLPLTARVSYCWGVCHNGGKPTLHLTGLLSVTRLSLTALVSSHEQQVAPLALTLADSIPYRRTVL